MELAVPSPKLWSAKVCEQYLRMYAKTRLKPRSARPDLAMPWVGDLANREVCDALLTDARSAIGQVTHFVHSAAPARRETDHALAVTRETWERMHAVNIDAGFHLSRELARQLIASREPGSFLMLTSLHADTPRNLPHDSCESSIGDAGQGIG